MMEDLGIRRRNIMLFLVVVMAVIAPITWYFNPITQQRGIGILCGAEAIGFAMVTYIYTRASDSDVKEFWMLFGAIAMAFLVGLAVT